MILVIAEKPGVAKSIAKVLGAAFCWDVLQTRLTIKKITKKQVQKRRICTKKQVQGITRKKSANPYNWGGQPVQPVPKNIHPHGLNLYM